MKNLYLSLIALLCSFSSFATVGPISGALAVCQGVSTALTDATTGGTWSSSNPAIATVGSTGVVTGVFTGSSSVGTATISYMVGVAYSTVVVTVNPYPTAILGTLALCVGYTTALTDATAGGTWSNYFSGDATIDPSLGIVTGLAAGTLGITYTQPTGCFVTAVVTVNAAPAPISGSLSTCVGASTALTDATPFGVWSSSNPAIGSVSTTGVVTGVSVGVAHINYVLGTGCMVAATVSVNPSPTPILGTLSACDGQATFLSDLTPGGTWSSSNPIIYNISPVTGIGTGISSGTAVVSYSIGSAACSAIAVVTINPLPGPILGTLTLCAGSSTTLTDSYPGGTWTSLTTVVSPTGVVTGATPGVDIITYTSAAGCTVTTVVTVNPIPPAITGATSVCVGATTTLTDAAVGGIWSSGNTSIAIVGISTGIVTGITAGITAITYTLATGCATTTTVAVITCTCSGTPAGGIAVASDTAHCYGYPTTFSLSGGVMISSAFSFQWQTSPDGTTWTDLAGATTATYTYLAPVSQYYQCVVTCVASGLTASSSPVHVTITTGGMIIRNIQH